MKYLICLLLFYGSMVNAIQGSSDIGSMQTNPEASAVITPAVTLNGGGATGANWLFTILATSTASTATTISIQTLNASNAVVNNIYLIVPANGTLSFSTAPMSFKIPTGFKIQVMNVNTVTGNVQATLYYATDGNY